MTVPLVNPLEVAKDVSQFAIFYPGIRNFPQAVLGTDPRQTLVDYVEPLPKGSIFESFRMRS